MVAQTTRGADRWTFLIGGVAAVLGSLLGMVGNLIHPATPINDAVGVAQAIAESDGWLVIHMAIVIGLILMLGGLMAIADSMHEPMSPRPSLALSRVAAIAGATVGLTLVTLDGVAAKQAADAWGLGAGRRTVSMQLCATLIAERALNFALVALFNILFAGVTFILYGLAVASSNVYPRWFGLVAVLAGFESIVAGLIQAESGSPVETARVLTIIGPTLITLWLLVMGVLLLRRSREPGVAALDDSLAPQRPRRPREGRPGRPHRRPDRGVQQLPVGGEASVRAPVPGQLRDHGVAGVPNRPAQQPPGPQGPG